MRRLNHECLLPTISVIVPVYNGEATIQRCVDSLLSQDYPSDLIEIIVIDNGSQDRTINVVKPYVEAGQIKLGYETRVLNAYGARNTGIAMAQGEILAFTDADCVAEQNWLRELIRGHEDGRVGIFIGEILPLHPKTIIERYRGEHFLSQRRDRGKVLPGCRTGNCAFRRVMLQEIGTFDADTTSGADWGLFFRGHQHGWKHVVNYSAVVYHKNYSTIGELWQQSLRYGSGERYRAALRADGESLSGHPTLSFQGTVRRSTLLAGSFLKRLFLHLAGKTRSQSDPELFVLWPLLELVTGIAGSLGYHRREKSYR